MKLTEFTDLHEIPLCSQSGVPYVVDAFPDGVIRAELWQLKDFEVSRVLDGRIYFRRKTVRTCGTE